MPDLKEYDIDTATTILKSFGLTISDKSEDFSDSVPEGQIISQTPKKDTEVTPADKITVVVSKGPKIKTTKVPSVVGKDQDTATGELQDAGLKVSVNSQETQDESQNGKVLKQTGEGNRVDPGTTIVITVGKYVAKQDPPVTNNPTQGNTKPGGNGSTPIKILEEQVVLLIHQERLLILQAQLILQAHGMIQIIVKTTLNLKHQIKTINNK